MCLLHPCQCSDWHLFLLSLDKKNQPRWWEAMEITTMDLSHNNITTLPPEMGSLTAIAVLNLSYNKLASLVPDLFALGATLKKLDLSG